MTNDDIVRKAAEAMMAREVPPHPWHLIAHQPTKDRYLRMTQAALSAVDHFTLLQQLEQQRAITEGWKLDCIETREQLAEAREALRFYAQVGECPYSEGRANLCIWDDGDAAKAALKEQQHG